MKAAGPVHLQDTGVADPAHPGHRLYVLLPSGMRLQSIRIRTSRHMKFLSLCCSHHLLSVSHMSFLRVFRINIIKLLQ